MYDELGISKRKRRSDAVRKPTPPARTTTPVSDRDLAPIDLQGRYRTQISDRHADIEPYFCSYRLLQAFSIDRDCVVAIERNPRHRDELCIIYEYDHRFYVGKIFRDLFTDLFCVECPASDIPLPLSEDVRIIGSPVGYFPVELLDSTDEIVFYPLVRN